MCLLNITQKIKNCICGVPEFIKSKMQDITDENDNLSYSAISSDIYMSSKTTSANSS